jgi:soluble lytic murein transglycosylase-like protein
VYDKFFKEKEVVFSASPDAKVNLAQIKFSQCILSNNKNITKEEANEIAHYVLEYSEEFNIDPVLVLAIIKTESGFNKYSISKAGAIGYMQVIPHWHMNRYQEASARSKSKYVNLYDAKVNIYMGVRIFREYLDTYKNINSALLRYNGSIDAEEPVYDTLVINAYTQIKPTTGSKI